MTATRYANVRVIDCTGAAPYGPTDVVVEDTRIAAIGEAARARTDARLVDRGGETVLPGLVNGDDYLSVKGIVRGYYSVYRQSSHFQILRAGRNALASLAQGITAVRDMGAIDRVNLILRDAIEARLVVGPHVYACGMPIAPAWSGPGVEPAGMTSEANDAAEVLAQTNDLVAAGVDFITIKVHRQDFKLDRKRWFTVEEMRPGIDAAHAAGLKVSAIGQEPIAYWRAIEAGADSVSSGRFIYEDPDLPRALAEQGVMLSANLAGWARAREFMTEEARANHRIGIARCIEAGVRMIAGTTFYGESVVDEIVALRSVGLGAMAALQAATTNGAVALGRDREFGTLDVGKRADLVFVDGDPLADPDVLRSPRLVVRGGVEYHPEALREAVGPLTEIRDEDEARLRTART